MRGEIDETERRARCLWEFLNACFAYPIQTQVVSYDWRIDFLLYLPCLAVTQYFFMDDYLESISTDLTIE